MVCLAFHGSRDGLRPAFGDDPVSLSQLAKWMEDAGKGTRGVPPCLGWNGAREQLAAVAARSGAEQRLDFGGRRRLELPAASA